MDIFQKTALGKFLSALTEAERQILFQCYIKDFIVLSIGVSSQEELQVSVWNKSSDSLEREKSDSCGCALPYQSRFQSKPPSETNSRGATEGCVCH